MFLIYKQEGHIKNITISYLLRTSQVSCMMSNHPRASLSSDRTPDYCWCIVYFLYGNGITLEISGHTEKFSICSPASVTQKSSTSRADIRRVVPAHIGSQSEADQLAVHSCLPLTLWEAKLLISSCLRFFPAQLCYVIFPVPFSKHPQIFFFVMLESSLQKLNIL